MGRQLGYQGRLGHAGLRVDLQYDEFTRTSGAIVVSKIRTAHAAAAKCLMGPQVNS